MRLSTFLHDLGRTVAYHPGLAPVLGGVVPTVLFCQLFWWTPEDSDSDGWFGKTSDEIIEATGLTITELGTARRILTERGLIQVKVKGSPPKLWFYVDRQQLDELWENRKDVIRERKKAKQDVMKIARQARAIKQIEADSIPRKPESSIPRKPESSIPRKPENSIPRKPENSIPRKPDAQFPENLGDEFSGNLKALLIDKNNTYKSKREREEDPLSLVGDDDAIESENETTVFSILQKFYADTITGQAETRRLEQAAIEMDCLQIAPAQLSRFLNETTVRPVTFVKQNFLVWREQQVREFEKRLVANSVGGRSEDTASRIAAYRRLFSTAGCEAGCESELPEYLQSEPQPEPQPESKPSLKLARQPEVAEPGTEESNVWDDVLAGIAARIDPDSFSTWFRPSSLASQSGQTLTIQLPDPVFQDWILNNYRDLLEEVLESAGLGESEILFRFPEVRQAA